MQRGAAPTTRHVCVDHLREGVASRPSLITCGRRCLPAFVLLWVECCGCARVTGVWPACQQPLRYHSLVPRHVTCARLSSRATGRPALRPGRSRVVRSPAGALASQASPVTGCCPAQPRRCNIVAVLTAVMLHRGGYSWAAGRAGAGNQECRGTPGACGAELCGPTYSDAALAGGARRPLTREIAGPGVTTSRNP